MIQHQLMERATAVNQQLEAFRDGGAAQLQASEPQADDWALFEPQPQAQQRSEADDGGRTAKGGDDFENRGIRRINGARGQSAGRGIQLRKPGGMRDNAEG
ncbi:hypothetical protein Nizo1839_0931 [Lactiplantibacillus plantarum]|nr:hypothetical protein Nizo1839_0931 [Lactiplantibacillus plantarum]